MAARLFFGHQKLRLTHPLVINTTTQSWLVHGSFQGQLEHTEAEPGHGQRLAGVHNR